MYYQNFSHKLGAPFRLVLVGTVVLFVGTLLLAHAGVLFAQTTDGEPATTAPSSTTDDGSGVGDSSPSSTTGGESEAGAVGVSTDPTDPGTSATGNTTTQDDAGDAVVATGDASASTDADTTENYNDTTSSTPDTSTTTIDNDNTATSSTAATADAGTGSNSATSSTGSATVSTGDAVAESNIVNVINTNIFDARGLLYFLNILAGNTSLDLRNLFSVLTDGAAPEAGCTLDACDSADTTLNISNDNTATVENEVAATASTGDNTATAGAGSATASTGDAYASANVLNLVNTNLTGTNYLLLAINNFGNLTNDVIFPGAEWFNDLFGSVSRPTGSNTTITNNNTAAVSSSVDVGADTGDNNATGTTATVLTGDAHAAATVVNQVNTNVLGDSLLFLFRIHGDWAGDVFGLPDGVSWSNTSDGIELMLDPSGTSAPFGSTEHLTVTNNNTATVTNNVSVFALTGDNEVAAASGDARVTTGDAYASANVVNVVNTNVLGRNYVLAIFNIFGNWTGNISFGQPDLWVGARAVVPNDVHAGQCYTYEVTINNLGDAAATHVTLDGIFDQAQQRVDGFSERLADRMRLHMGKINAGKSETVTLPGCLAEGLAGSTDVNMTFVVDSTEPDADDANNAEAIGFVTVPGGGGGKLRLGPAKLALQKTASKEVLTASSSVDYQITITNTGDPVYNALLVDTIYDPEDNPIHEQRWGLDTIHSHESIVVSYTAFFNSSTTPGAYRNEAFISGTENNADYEHNLGKPADSPVASTTIFVTAPEEPTTTTTVCEPLLTSYIRYGAPNDSEEVSKLQYFLKTLEHDTRVTLTGTYDTTTYDAVRAFQARYADDVLAPWGAENPTGYIYYTTQKKINELWCNRQFPLSATQQREIRAFKKRITSYVVNDEAVPQETFNEVGVAPQKHEDTQLAVATQPMPDQRSNVQVAAAAHAVANDSVQSIWQKLRERLIGFWLH